MPKKLRQKILKRALRSGLGIEKREITTYVPLTLTGNVDVSGVALINSIAQGDESTNRQGRKIKHDSVTFNMNVGCSSSNGVCGVWSIVLDRQPNGSLPAITDIYDTTSGAPTPLATKNTLLYQDRFVILRSVPFSIAPASLGSSPMFQIDWVDLSKLTGIDESANFNGPSTGIGNINHGAVYLCYRINSMNGLNMTGAATAVTKYRWTDV